MAEIPVEKVDEQLNCSICLDTYADPKILQCFHVFCQKCLVKLVIRNQQGQLSLSCPTCRQVTPLPPGGTRGLQSDFRINRLLELVDVHKKAAGAVGGKSKNLRKCSTICCSVHDKREVELFCETCEELICYKCAVKGGKHHDHDYIDINESFERYKEAVTPLLKALEKRMTAIVSMRSQLDGRHERVTQQRAAIEAEIRDYSKRLHKIIDERQAELIRQLDKITKVDLAMLAEQKEMIDTLQAQVSSCLQHAKDSLKTGIQWEVLVMKTDILKQVKGLTTASQPKIPKLYTTTYIEFSVSNHAAAACESFGRVCEIE